MCIFGQVCSAASTMLLARATVCATGRQVQRRFKSVQAGATAHQKEQAQLDREEFIFTALSLIHAFAIGVQAFGLGYVVHELVNAKQTNRALADANAECTALMRDMMQQRDAKSREVLECTRTLEQPQCDM